MNDTLDKIKNELIQLDGMPAEQMKAAAYYKAKHSAFAKAFKETIQKNALAEASTNVYRKLQASGQTKISEAMLERMGRVDEKYVSACNDYSNSLEIAEFLGAYLSGVQMDHESQIANTYKLSSEIKAGITHTGS